MFPGGDPVKADVELGAVGRVGVLGMGVGDTEGVLGGVQFGAEEATLEGVLAGGLAAGPLGLGGPVTDAPELVEPEAGGASVLLCLALDACVKDVTHAGIGVSVEAVQTGAQVIRALRGL